MSDTFSYEDAAKPAPSTQAPEVKPFSYEEATGEPPARGLKGWGQDIAATAVKGAIAVPEALVGLADIPTGGRVGKFLENEGGAVGFRPKQAKEMVNDWHSDATKEAQRKFQEADGIVDKAGVALSNPSLIATAVGESLPSMGLGGVAARGLMAATKLGQMGAKGAVMAGAAGEGATMAGAQAEQIRQETQDGLLTPTQAAMSAATGVVGGAVSLAGGKLAQRLGIGDAETMLAQGVKGMDKQFADKAAQAAANPLVADAAVKSIPRKVIEGAITEGFLEELPQSMAEQIFQNIALDKPWYDELDSAVVMGVLSGGAMGAGAAGFHGFREHGAKAGQPAPGDAPGDAPTGALGSPDAPAPGPGMQRVADEFASRLQALQEQEQGEAAVPQTAPPDGAAALAQQQAQARAARDAEIAASRAVESPDDEILASTGANMRPSEAMGLRSGPEAGSLENAAAMAVDSGAHGQMQEAASLAQVAEAADKGELGTRKQEQAAQDQKAVDPDTGEISGMPSMADWSDVDLSNAFRHAQSLDVRRQLAQELSRRRAARDEADLQAELRAEQAANDLPDAPDHGFARVQEDAGAVPKDIQIQGAQQQAQAIAPGSQAEGANVANLAQLNRKKLAEMSSDELQQLSALLPADHSRQQKIQKAIQTRAEQTQPAINQGAQHDGTQTPLAEQSSTQPAQAGRAQAEQSAAQGLTDATPAQDNGRQAGATTAPQAQAQEPTREQRAARMDAAGQQWTRMPTGERSALVGRLKGVKPVLGKNMPGAQWGDLNVDIQRKLADAMEPTQEQAVGDEKPFAAESGTLGIPRAEMPQVPTANHGGLVKHLNAQGIAHETTTVDAAELKPTQAEYSPSKVEAAKSTTGDRAVIVSKDGHIIDGHHQAVAAAEEGKQVKAIVLNAPIEKALEAVTASPSANAPAPAPAAQAASLKEQTVSDGFPMSEAVQSYSGISHTGRSRAEGDMQAFDKFMKGAQAAGETLAETEAQREALGAAVEQLRTDYLQQYRSLMNTRASAYSGFVAGRGNLNSKQANARNSALDKAMERFNGWVRVNVDRVSKAALAARTPEQIKADRDKVAATIKEKADKKAADLKAQLTKFLSFKSGDTLVYGKNFAVTKVSYDKDGYPSSLTFKALDGSPLSDDKMNVNEALKDKGETLDQAKTRIRALVDEVRAENPELKKGAGAIRAAASAKAAKATPEPATQAAEASHLDRHNAIEEAISAGTLELPAYQEAFASLEADRDAVMAELNKLTKDELLRAGGSMFAYRMRDEKKAELVQAAYQQMLNTYALGRNYGPSSYFMSAESIAKNKAEKAQALRELVANTTADDLAARAAEIKAARDEFKAEREAKAKALAEPNTLQDFRSFMRHWMEKGDTSEAAYVRLTPEQRQQFDALEAEQTKDSRDAAKRRAQVSVASAGNTTAGEVIATKHTKHGHDLFVVKLAERVERDAYDTLNSSAKRLGGSYSSYRGNGAVPGFQFRTREAAEAFQKLVGGDTAQAQELANQRRDAFDDDKSQSAAERLRTMADALDERATEALGADRKVNTARRARFAASADAAARTQQALAGTMRNIAQAIDSGAAKFLDSVRQRVQVDYLMGQLRTAKSNQLQAKYPDYGERMTRQGEPMDAETVDFAQFPRFEMFRSDLASLARQLLEIDGGKKMGAALEKLADDVTDAYTDWAKANLLRVSHFGNKAQGGFAEFASKDVAERAIKRSGLVGKAVVLQIKRGQNRVILSPGEAMQQGLWQGDGDKRIRLSMEFVEGLATLGKRKGSKVLALPWQLESALENRQRLQRMGIQTPAEFRSALRELASLQQEMATPDRVKELERSMVGRANDGLDFFPTSPAVVQGMLDAAEIAEGMSVLEPSAGMGHIADAIVEETGVWPDVVELSGDRRELLEAKGFHLVEVNDFLNMEPRRFFTYGDTFRAPDGVKGTMRGVGGMGSQRVRLEDAEGNRLGLYDRSELVGVAQNGTWSGYDRIIMNPPFSDGRDIQHVLHAYSLLRPGGRIVAIMGEGAFFHSNKRAEAFREWLDERGATNEKLPDGSFMDPSLPVNTGVAARMVVIDKPEGDHQLSPRPAEDAAPQSAGAETKTAAFKRWFGDSKVVGEDGKPLVMYHGTSGNQDGDAFTFFDTYASNYGLMGMGGYFTADASVASSYTEKGDGGTPTVYPVYLSIKNPLDMDAKADAQAWAKQFPDAESYHEGGETNESWYRAAEDALSEEGLPKWEGAEVMQNGLRAMGFDGITHVGGGRVKSDSVKHRVFITFEPEQTKSATGNNGNFDPNSPNIANYAGNAKRRPGSSQDKAVMQAIADGKGARNVLRLIASGSKDPFLRKVARMLLRSGITPNIEFGHIGRTKKGDPIHGQYRGKSDTIAIAASAEYAAERIFMHEAMHAATMRALSKPGLPKLQLQKLLEHVRKQKSAAGFYGTTNLDEFVAEVFTNPDFQNALRNMSAPKGGTIKTAWDGFVRILRSILSLPNDSTNALSQALELGVAVLREDMGLRRKGVSARVDANMADELRGLARAASMVGNENSVILLGALSPQELALLQREGVPVKEGFSHAADMFAVRHALNRHGDPKIENNRGQIAITEDDVAKIAEAVKTPTAYVLGSKTPRGQDLVGIIKRLDDGTLLYLEEVRTGRKTLAMTSMRKYPGTTDFDTIANSVLPSNARSDTGAVRIVYPQEGVSQDGDSVANFGTDDFARVKNSALDQLHKSLSHPGTVSIWDKTLGTMRNLGERVPQFKPVYEAAQRFIDDVSMLANNAADFAPRLMPRVETLADLKKRPITAADNKAVAKPLFEGTLMWARDIDGTPVTTEALNEKYRNVSADEKAQIMLRTGKIQEGVLKMWRAWPLEQFESAIETRFESTNLKPGVVWSDAELKSLFKTSDDQISLYREARAAIDRSIDMTARADMMRTLGKDYAGLRSMVLDAPTPDDAMQLITEHLQDEARGSTDSQRVLALNNEIVKIHEKAQALTDHGYAPLSRFGKYTVDVVSPGGEREYFGMFESKREAHQMAEKMRDVFKGAAVTQGTMSEKAFKLFAGITPESVEQFGSMLGLDSDGDKAKDKAFQAYLHLAKNNHSALKRLIHRKGIDGYSEDVGRVLASFVYSNARMGSGGLNAGTMENSMEAIPKEMGELRDVAAGLRSYIQDPQEEGQAIRGMLFAQYLGGSVASAVVNMTQPFQITMPWLSQYGGMAKASKQMARALNDMRKSLMDKKFTYEPELAKALKAAEDDGTVSPQEIHQLMAQARGSGSLRTGDGTKLGDARAAASNNWERVKVAWGQPFALAEQFNRRSTFIAAYRTAVGQGMADPAAFARKAVLETQFVYSKANKPKWARGAIGGTLFTFKTYSVSYLELMHRMWTQGGPEGKRAVGWAVAMLMLMSGAGGLPFLEDAEDLIDGAGQLMGYNISAKHWRKQLLADTLGKEFGDFVDQGISGMPGAPIDVSGRLGLGNLIPGTGLFLTKQNRERDLLEIAGPAGDLVARGFTGARKALTGDFGGAALEMAPTAVRNAAKGINMAASGIYKDTKGYKVIDTTLDEALFKAIGFQPKSVSEVQESNSFMQRSRSFYTQTSSEIKSQWASAVFNKDDAALQPVRDRLTAWNRDNPDQPIVVKIPDVMKKVREMGKDRTDRIADTAPKALRAQMREMAAEASR